MKKLSLHELKVNSFVTEVDAEFEGTIQGGIHTRYIRGAISWLIALSREVCGDGGGGDGGGGGGYSGDQYCATYNCYSENGGNCG